MKTRVFLFLFVVLASLSGYAIWKGRSAAPSRSSQREINAPKSPPPDIDREIADWAERTESLEKSSSEIKQQIATAETLVEKQSGILNQLQVNDQLFDDGKISADEFLKAREQIVKDALRK